MAEMLRVNPIACDAHGACAELLPEMITLDEWGYPILDPRPVPPALEKHARAAVSACPTLALRLTRELPARIPQAHHPHPLRCTRVPVRCGHAASSPRSRMMVDTTRRVCLSFDSNFHFMVTSER
jgi:ferredoxin